MLARVGPKLPRYVSPFVPNLGFTSRRTDFLRALQTFPTRTEGSVKKHWYKDMHYAEFAEDEVRSTARPDLHLKTFDDLTLICWCDRAWL